MARFRHVSYFLFSLLKLYLFCNAIDVYFKCMSINVFIFYDNGWSEYQRNRKKMVVKPIVKNKQLPTVDQVTGKKIPQSFVFSRTKLPASLRQLEMDLRKLMLPYTALKLKVSFFLPSFRNSCLMRTICERSN